MKVLVIPDVHLKPWMFDAADFVIKTHQISQAVCLGDLADDFNKTYQFDLYKETYNRAIEFQKKHRNTLWCYGNHDICYLWNQRETGFSIMATSIVCQKITELQFELIDPNQYAFIHRIDNVLFCHGGLSDMFVRSLPVPFSDTGDIDLVLEYINRMGMKLWSDDSPLWYRPYGDPGEMYRSDEFLHVVGHTPKTKIEVVEGVLSTDTFSTYRDGTPIGPQAFVIVDTETKAYETIDVGSFCKKVG